MANQSSSMVIVSSTYEDISNWEFINSSDYHDDHDVVVVSDDDTFIFDLSSSSDHDDHHDLDVDDDVVHEEEEEEDGPTNDDVDVGTHQNEAPISHPVHAHDDYDYGHGYEYGYGNDGVDVHVHYDDEGYVAKHQKNDGHYDYSHGYEYNDVGHVCDDDDDSEEEEDGYGMDDMLVPWEVKDVFVRQRIKKTGKKAVVTKRVKSKKSPLVFTRPGCVRGKFALGLKAY